MPSPEVAEDADLYRDLSLVITDAEELWRTQTRFQEFEAIDPNPSHRTPAQVDQQIQLTLDCMESAFRWGVMMRNTSDDHKVCMGKYVIW